MGHRQRPFRQGLALLVAVMAAVGTLALGTVSAGAISDDDCATLTDTNLDQGSTTSDPTGLAAQADGLNATADDISDRKLQKGLRTMAAVYEAASEGENTKAASVIFARQSKKWAKGYKPYAKALNECMMKSVEDLPKP